MKFLRNAAALALASAAMVTVGLFAGTAPAQADTSWLASQGDTSWIVPADTSWVTTADTSWITAADTSW